MFILALGRNSNYRILARSIRRRFWLERYIGPHVCTYNRKVEVYETPCSMLSVNALVVSRLDQSRGDALGRPNLPPLGYAHNWQGPMIYELMRSMVTDNA